MKKIEAIIKPFKFDEVKDALAKIGIHGITVTEVKGYGQQQVLNEVVEKDFNYSNAFLPKLKLELVVSSKKVDQIVEEIIKATKTGKVGDGKIFIYNIEKAVRIRTSETDENAI